MISGFRPSVHPDQRLLFQSWSDRCAVVGQDSRPFRPFRNGYFVRRRKSQGLPIHGRYVACLPDVCGSQPSLHRPASQPGSSNLAPAGRCAPKRPRSAVGMARRCPDAPNALMLPDDGRTTGERRHG